LLRYFIEKCPSFACNSGQVHKLSDHLIDQHFFAAFLPFYLAGGRSSVFAVNIKAKYQYYSPTDHLICYGLFIKKGELFRFYQEPWYSLAIFQLQSGLHFSFREPEG
jgi:hypothetical protein